MLLPLIEGCEQVGLRRVIKFEWGGGTEPLLNSDFEMKDIE